MIGLMHFCLWKKKKIDLGSTLINFDDENAWLFMYKLLMAVALGTKYTYSLKIISNLTYDIGVDRFVKVHFVYHRRVVDDNI